MLSYPDIQTQYMLCFFVNNILLFCRPLKKLRSGKELALLLAMHQEAPEMFYKCAQDMLRINDLLTLDQLVWCLHDLSSEASFTESQGFEPHPGSGTLSL